MLCYVRVCRLKFVVMIDGRVKRKLKLGFDIPSPRIIETRSKSINSFSVQLQ